MKEKLNVYIPFYIFLAFLELHNLIRKITNLDKHTQSSIALSGESGGESSKHSPLWRFPKCCINALRFTDKYPQALQCHLKHEYI